MRKILYVLTALCIIALCACQKNDDSSQTELKNKGTSDNSIVKVQEISMPEAFEKSKLETGGDELYFYKNKYIPNITFVSIELIEIMNEPKIGHEWVDKFTFDSSTRNWEEYTLFNFIKECNIEKELVYSWLNSYNSILSEMKSPHILETSDIDIIYSGDMDKINEHFASQYALVKDGKIYTPEWIYTHGVQDYVAEGLPIDLVEEKINQFKDSIPFTNEAKKALEVKVSNFQKYSNFKKAGKEIEFVPTPFNTENTDANSKSVYGEEYFIDKNGNKYDMVWLSSHTIQDYQEVGITTEELKQLLEQMSDYNYTSEYDWIESAYNRMIADIAPAK